MQRIPWLVLLLCTACVGKDQPPAGDSDPPIDSPEPTSTPEPGDTDALEDTDQPVEAIDLEAESCEADVFVGLADAGVDCQTWVDAQTTGQWAAWSLFFQDGPGADFDFESLEALEEDAEALQRWCVAEREPGAPAPDPLLLQPDCGVVVPLETPAEIIDAVQPTYRSHMLTSASLPAALPPASQPTRIVVIDTAVTGEAQPFDPPDQARHGCVVGALAQEISCVGASTTSGDCRATLRSRLALHRTPGEPVVANPPEGGFYGTQRRLARQITQAVAAWRFTSDTENLILNLSVGWDPRYNEPASAPGTLRPSAAAVREALRVASCRGALIIAAAGNRTGGPDDLGGPMFPAGWEDTPVDPSCGVHGTASYAPLVHAVGAVAWDDLPTLNSRDNGFPRLAAPGFHAMPDLTTYAPSCGVNGRPISGLTGSSVAAALASGTAAAIWSAAPDLTPHEVMELLYRGGLTLDPAPSGQAFRSDFGIAEPSHTPVSVHKLSVCGAYQALCDDDPGVRGCPVTCSSTPAFSLSEPDAGLVVTAPTLTADASTETLRSEAEGCGLACPHDRFVNGFAAPQGTLPLPGTDPCLECGIRRQATSPNAGDLFMAINPEQGARLLNTHLSFFDTAGSRTGVVKIGRVSASGVLLKDGLEAGQVISVPNVEMPPDATRARLEWKTLLTTPDGRTQKRSATSEILVAPAPQP